MACGAWIARVKVSQGEVRHLAALPLVATNPYQNPNLCTRSDRERKTTESARGDGSPAVSAVRLARPSQTAHGAG